MSVWCLVYWEKDKGHQLSDKDWEFVGKKGHIWIPLRNVAACYCGAVWYVTEESTMECWLWSSHFTVRISWAKRQRSWPHIPSHGYIDIPLQPRKGIAEFLPSPLAKRVFPKTHKSGEKGRQSHTLAKFEYGCQIRYFRYTIVYHRLP